MRAFQEAMEQALHGVPQQVLLQLITQKLVAQGIRLSARDRELLAGRILNGAVDNLQLQRWKWWDRQRITIDFTPQELEQMQQRITEFLENQLPTLVEDVSQDLSGKILIHLKRKWRAESRRQRREMAGFTKRLQDRWRLPLEGLRMLLTLSVELGMNINKELRESPVPSRKHLVDVLTRSHARACQVTDEIVCLLAGGFADGAMARWRTLHEIAVVASFIGARGEDLAERYVLHQIVESRRAAVDYKKCHERLGYAPLDEGEIKALEDSYGQVVARFGGDFESGYGWAAQALGNPRPSFADIERAAGIDHLRAHYRMASHHVHANPKGVYFKLGLMGESQVLLAGPSNAGLADPGHSAAISLTHVSATLGLMHPTLDNIVALRIIAQLVAEIGEAFGVAHERLETDEAGHRARAAD